MPYQSQEKVRKNTLKNNNKTVLKKGIINLETIESQSCSIQKRIRFFLVFANFFMI